MSSIVESQNSGSEQSRQSQQQQEQQALTRSRLVARLLQAGPDIREFMHDLLTVQAIVVNGTEAVGFLLEQGPQGMGLRDIHHIRPDNSDAETRAAALNAFREIVGQCVQQGKDGVIDVGSPHDSTEPQFCLVTLLRNEQNNIVAASAVITRARDNERAQQRLETMRLVAGYFDMWLMRRTIEQGQQIQQRHQDVLQSAGAFATGEGFQAAAMNLCNELVSRTGASRVSIGWVKLRSVKLMAMSHTEQFDRKQELCVNIVKAMEECVDQAEIVQFDPDPAGLTSNNITRSAMALSRQENGAKIVTLPLRHKDEVVAVMTLEYPPTRAITAQLTTSLAVASEVLAPQIYDRYQNDRYLATKAGLSTVWLAKKTFGIHHTLAKLIVLAVLGALAFILIFSPMYRVPAPFQFKAYRPSVVSAPVEGTLEEVLHREGDHVNQGDVLLKFDSRDLQKEALAAEKEAAQSRDQARIYLHDNDPDNDAQAQVEIKKAEAAEAQAELKNLQKERTIVRAPVTGMIVRGDLRNQQSSRIQFGQDLMEIRPDGKDGRLVAQISVAERDVQKVKVGSEGQLATNSRPNEKFNFKVTRIVPMGVSKDAGNVLHIEGEIENPSPDWQPGQEGEARIDWEKKSLFYQGTHRLWEWVTLKLWM